MLNVTGRARGKYGKHWLHLRSERTSSDLVGPLGFSLDDKNPVQPIGKALNASVYDWDQFLRRTNSAPVHLLRIAHDAVAVDFITPATGNPHQESRHKTWPRRNINAI